MTDQMTALILQGGGALGAYQAGVFEQLAAHDYTPDWVVGTSIGAINGAIIAGNKPADRVPQLKSFWESLAPTEDWFSAWSPLAWGGAATLFAPFYSDASKSSAVFSAITNGVNGFFKPKTGGGFDLGASVPIGQAGFYDTTPLRQTLLDHVDFAYLNAGAVRLSVCAVDVETAEMRIFDTNDSAPLTPEHIMASGALPPAFPPVMIDGRAYWDGGIYSNSPLEVLLAENRNRDALVFMVDLWDPTETLPQSMAEVMDRQKAIQYSARATQQLNEQHRIEELQQAIRALAAALPPEALKAPELAALASKGCDRTVNVVHLIMAALDSDNQFKDVDFSAVTVKARWTAGNADAARALTHKAWLEPVPPHAGLVIHDLEQQ